jgi:hypothetical protein
VKRLLIGIIAALSILSAAAATVAAAPKEDMMSRAGPFEGTFAGVVYGDNGSTAPLTLDLTHRGDQIQGDFSLGSGLYIKGGICGGANVPAAEQYASGKTLRDNPNRLVANTKVDVGRFDINVKLDGNVSADGKVITAKAKLDLPWFCGRDPVINATLYRAN